MSDSNLENIKNYKKHSKEIAENMLEHHKRSASALRENLLKRKQQLRMLKAQDEQNKNEKK